MRWRSRWKVVYDGKTPPPGEVVRPDERLSWGRTAGLGAQHVVAMFGATFVFPLIMGLNPQLAIMMSGIATICFLLIVQGKVPSYLGTSASFVGGVAAIRAQGGTSAEVTGAIFMAGALLAIIGLIIHFSGSRLIYTVFPPVVTGAVVMLIGFNLAPVVADIYWPQDQWNALITMIFVIICSVGLARLRRSHLDLPRPRLRLCRVVDVRTGIFGQITSFDPGAGEITPTTGPTSTASPLLTGSASRRRRRSAPTVPRSSAGTCRASTSRSSCSFSRR